MSTGKNSPCGLQQAVEPVEHEAGLDPDRALLRVQLEHAVQILGEIDHQAGADRLAGLRGAAAARHDRHARLARDPERRLDVGVGPGEHDADRLDLVDRGVGAVAAAIEGLEPDLALERAGEPRRQLRRARVAAEIGPPQDRGHRPAPPVPF